MRALRRLTGDPRLRFLAVGGLSTALHYGVLVAGVEALHWPAVAATTAGFLAGAALNYGLNRWLSFSSHRQHREALPRFAVMVALGTLLNSGLLQVALSAGVHYLPGQVTATLLVLIYNYLVLRHWVFPATSRDTEAT